MQNNNTLRIAHSVVPHVGGTYTFYKTLRNALSRVGITVLNPYIGCSSHEVPHLKDDGCHRITPSDGSRKGAAQAFANWIIDNDIDVLVPGMSLVGAIDAIPHLAPKTRVVTRCVHITDGAYRTVLKHRNRTSRIAVSSRRQYKDLVNDYKTEPNQIELIPHAIDYKAYAQTLRERRHCIEKIRIVYLGRIDHFQKQVFLLPKVVEWLERLNTPYRLDIIGSGPKEKSLQRSLASRISTEQVRWLGYLGPGAREAALVDADVLIMPSRSEGFGFSLIEAMGAGVVPVAARLRDVTDWIVDDGRNGLLVPCSNAFAYAEAISRLHRNRQLLEAMRHEAITEVEQRFSIEQFTVRWAALFQNVTKLPLDAASPLPWSQFRPTPPPIAEWKRFVPRRTKSILMRTLVKCGLRKY